MNKHQRMRQAGATVTRTMRIPTRRVFRVAVLCLALASCLILLSGCGGGTDGGQTTTAAGTDAIQRFRSASRPDDWNLILVNKKSMLPKDYSVNLTQLKNGESVDERCYPDLQKMMDACRAEGLTPVVCSAYRPMEKQEKLFRAKVQEFTAQGYHSEEARKEAGEIVAVPGTSEHQLGLAADIVDINNQNLDNSQESTAVQKWLLENSWKYGFVLRYPDDKGEITGIIYEPWHYRYVGIEPAKEMYEQGVCLEEYLDLISASP